MGFNLVNLAITVRADDIHRFRSCLPQVGQELAVTCRSALCDWPGRACETCSGQETCGWHYVFGQKLTSDPTALKRHQKPPLPFVLSFPVLDRSSETNADIEFGLVVIGPALSQLEMLLNGLAELLSARSFYLTHIACRDYQGSVHHAVDARRRVRSGKLAPDNLVITSTEGLLESRVWDSSKLNIRMLSPLRLLENGHPATRFEFGRFARSVMRRVSSLAYYYGESEFDCDFKELSRLVDNVICTDDHFTYHNVKDRRCSGVVGYGSFSGDFSRLMPFLVIGSYVHTGKSSSFGMGTYEVYPEAASANQYQVNLS